MGEDLDVLLAKLRTLREAAAIVRGEPVLESVGIDDGGEYTADLLEQIADAMDYYYGTAIDQHQ